MGRPKLQEGEAFSERVVAHLRPVEYEELVRRAKEQGVRVGTIAREILARALQRKSR